MNGFEKDMEEQDENIEGIGKKSAKGVAVLAFRQLILGAISTVASLVIFSILTPSEVGVYVAVIAAQRIISFFTDFGFGAALIQKKEAVTKDDVITTFTFQSSVTLGIFILVFLFQKQIGDLLRLNSEGATLFLVLVFTIFLSSFKTIPSILLERKIHFHRLVIPQILESLVFNLLLIVLVLNEFGLASFSWAFLISSIISIPLYYYVNPWPVGIGIKKSAFTHLKFGFQFQLKNILATIKDDFLTVILTRILTFTEIGYIGFAQRLSFLAYRYIVDSVTKVSFSTYSRLQNDKEILRRAIEKTLFFVAILMFPILIGLAIAGPSAISFIPQWKDKWTPAALSLVFFSLNAVVSSLSGILVNVLDSNGKVKTTLKLMVIWTTLTWVLTPLLIFLLGFNGVAIASFIVTLTIIYTIYLVRKVVDFSFWRSIQFPSIATMVMGAVLLILLNLVASNIFTFIGICLLSGLVYCAVLYLLCGQTLKKDLIKIFRKE